LQLASFLKLFFSFTAGPPGRTVQADQTPLIKNKLSIIITFYDDDDDGDDDYYHHL